MPPPLPPGFVSEQQPAPPLPQVINGPPREAPLQAPAVDINTRTNTAHTAQTIQQNDTQGRNFTDEHSLRQQYRQNPAIQTYETILPIFRAAQTAADNTAGDQQMVYSFAKIMDPGSVVREGEQASVAATGSIGQRVQGYLDYIHGNGRLTPQMRQDLLQEMAARGANFDRDYMRVRNDTVREAERYGFDPHAIIGQHAALPYRQQMGLDPRPEQPGNPTRGAPNPPEGGSSDGPDGLVVDITGGHIPATLSEAPPDWRAAFVAAKRQDPSLTYEGWIGAYRAAHPAAPAPGSNPRDTAADLMDILPMNPMTLAHTAIDNSLHALVGSGYTEEQAAGRRAAQVPFGLGDEVRAGLRTLAGHDSYSGNLALEQGINAYDGANYSLSQTLGDLGGNAALPMGRASSVRSLALLGGGYGAAHGFGSTNGSFTDRLIGAGEQGASGAILAGGLGLAAHGVGALAARRGASVPDNGRVAAQDLLAAAQRQDVPLMPADVGGPMTGRLTAGMAQLPFSTGPIVNGAQRVNARAGERLGELAAAEGAPLRQEQLGEAARTAAQGYVERSGREGRRLYDTARAETGDTFASGNQAVGALDSHLSELRQTANTSGPEISALEALRGDLTTEAGDLQRLPIDALRRLRSNVRATAMQEGLRGTDYQRRAGDVLDKLSEDVSASLPPAARDAFRNADRQWAERLDVIDNVMNHILGPKDDRSAEAVATRLISMSRGDSARLRTFIDHIGPEEAGTVRASLIQELGRATSGQQGAAGEGFSLSTFLTNWDRLPERSRETLFRGANRADVDDLAMIAEGARESAKYANTSNTAGASSTRDIARFADFSAAWGTMGATAIIENLTGRILASQPLVRLLAHPPMDRARAVRRLAAIAAREPQIASDIIPIQQALESTVGRAAAQNEDDRR